MSRGCDSPLPACAVIVAMLSATAGAQDGRVDGRLYEAALPGGIRTALSALDDRAAADRSQFLLELIRRFHQTPITAKADPRLVPLRSLLAQLDLSSNSRGAAGAPPDTVPLPLPPGLWIDVVFGGHATPETLVSAILRSRNASLLYGGLLSLDDDTRQWLATKRDLIADLASEHTAAFLVAAPGLRVRDGRMLLPGGEAANPAWLALAGVNADTPSKFIRRVVELREGRFAYFLRAMSQLSAAQIGFALKLDSSDPDARVEAARHLYEVFEHVATGWDIDRRPFWRPSLDPALLLGEVRVDERGRPILPGSRRFWSEVLGGSAHEDRDDARDGRSQSRAPDPVDFYWLCERVFAGAPVEHQRRYNIVLFASRNLERVSPDIERDAIEAVRAAGRYPALTAALERARLAEVATFAAAARRATSLSTIRDRTRAVRSLLQFQGALALITRAAVRGGLPGGSLSPLVSSLSAVDVSKQGDYEGRLVRWLDAHLISPAGPGADRHLNDTESGRALEGNATGVLEQQLLRMLAGSFALDPGFVEWEGTRYRVDLPTAEATRLSRLLGDEPRPYISTARALVNMAGTLDERNVSADRLRAAADRFAEVGEAIGNELPDDDARRHRDIAATMQRAVRTADRGRAARLAPDLRLLADGLLARGLLELAYAAAFGQPGATAISTSEAADRHDFGLATPMGSMTWQLPEAGSWNDRGWHVTGSLLGLDVRLARFSLMRVSSRPPARKPSLNESDRRVFMEAVSLIEPATLSETRRDAMIAALRKGRARLAAVRSPSDVLSLADEIRLSPARRTLLAWAVAHEPERVPVSLSLSELLWLGVETRPPAGMFDPWGAPGEPRVGCLCLRLIDRGPWETLAGRWNTGMFASGFPDLNLRLAELLAELRMPAALLGPVLASATVDFVENVNSRDQDDRRGLLEFVHALSRERVEEYLALLTTDGPLVPVGDAADPASHTRSPQ